MRSVSALRIKFIILLQAQKVNDSEGRSKSLSCRFLQYRENRMSADVITLTFTVGNAVFTAHLQSGFFNSRGKRWKVLHRHPDYEIHFFEKGGFDFYCGGKPLSTSSPSALLLSPLVSHSFFSESEDAERVCLLFDLKKSGEGEAYAEYSGILSSLGDYTVVTDLVSSLSRFRVPSEDLRPFENETALKNELCSVFIELFSKLRAAKKPSSLPPVQGGKNDRNKLLADIFKYIEDNFERPSSPGDLALALHFSTRQLERLIKTELQTTFTGLLNRCRVENVCKQLDGSQSPELLSRLAEQNGFPDYSTFYRNFKKHTGKSPTEYLKTK